MDIIPIIAEAIRKADSSYFFENYTKQAKAVVKELSALGYVLAPKEPTKEMVKAGVYAISLGMIDAKKLATEVYKDMLEADE